jgi:hypothetical protein
MRRTQVVLIFVQVMLVLGFVSALRSGAMPLGVRGEWEWLRLPVAAATPDLLALAIGGLSVAAYAGFAALGLRFLHAQPSRFREALAVAALVVASVAVQFLTLIAAPEGYGLSKWALALYQHGSSGYYTIARKEIGDTRNFLADYPEWIRHQDALHIGTHPPGLLLVSKGLLSAMNASPETARRVVESLPSSVEAGFRAIDGFDPLPRADRAALALTGALTLLACAATVVPLYLLGRAYLSPTAAWTAAALWPLVPSAILFQPTADTAFPLISTAAIALAAHAARLPSNRGTILAFAAGLVLAFGMMFTLAFLAVGLVVGLVLATSPELRVLARVRLLVVTGLGFLALTFLAWGITRANPFVIWWWNQHNHARFYVEYPRSYLPWVLANPIELAIGMGLPATVLGLVGIPRAWKSSPASLATLTVLLILTVTGKNLSEVARLWLPMMPPLLVASAAGMERVGAGPKLLAATIALVGLQTLALQATIQVVYPV